MAKQTPINCKIIEVNHHIKESSQIIELLIPSSVKLEYHLSEDQIFLNIDPTHLDQIVMNLLINAKEAINTSGKIIVTTKQYIVPNDHDEFPDANQGAYLYLSIEDNGVGISEENMENNIFELFFTTKPYGTGLGLVNVKRAIETYNGYLNISSKLGEYTKVEMIIPQSTTEVTTQESKHKIIERSISGKILLIEDDHEVRNFIEEGLGEHGILVESLLDQQAILSFVEHNRDEIDTILSDIVLPNLNSIQLIEQIQKEYPSIKVLFMSGYGEDIIDNYNKQGKDIHLINKPFTIKDLLKNLRRL